MRKYRFPSHTNQRGFTDVLSDHGCNYLQDDDGIRVPYEEPWVEAVAQDWGGVGYDEPENPQSTIGVDPFTDVDAYTRRAPPETPLKTIKTKRRKTRSQP